MVWARLQIKFYRAQLLYSQMLYYPPIGRVVDVVRKLLNEKINSAINISIWIDFRNRCAPIDGSILIEGTSLNLFKAPSPSNAETRVIFIKKMLP